MNFKVLCVKTREPDVYRRVLILHTPSNLQWDLELDEDDWNKLNPFLPKDLQRAISKKEVKE